ncbi:MAG: hypothetical protein HYX66_06085 [Ignavibacteria bacterium]|nr:hypothetical protein [Ignavibacteria bacterium]
MKILASSSFPVLAVLVACSGQPSQPVFKEHEAITSVELTLVANQPPRDTTIVVWQDSDGSGEVVPDRADTIRLDSSKSYFVRVRVFNTSVTPAKDLTTTIRQSEENHQFFYGLEPPSLATVGVLDLDSRYKPVGLSFDLSAQTAGVGKFTALLSHWVDFMKKDGVSPGDTTDIRAEFPIEIVAQ